MLIDNNIEIKAIVHSNNDNTASAFVDLKKGEQIELNCAGIFFVELKNDIPLGHKFAIKKIKSGEKIIKYGYQIGIAIQEIDSGYWVHVHNVESLRGRGDLEKGRGNKD